MKKDGRLQIRVPQDLKEWVQKYAEDKHTDISTLVVRFFVRLREAETQKQDADQI
jgi:hypothetical protein